MKLRLFIPRYSLRTLVVFLLLVTSAGWLWSHWEAWYKTASSETACEGLFRHARFTDDGGAIEILASGLTILTPESGVSEYHITPLPTRLYDARTGRLLEAIPPATEPYETGREGLSTLAARLPRAEDLFSPDRRRCLETRVSGSLGATNLDLYVIDTRTEAPLFFLEREAENPQAACWAAFSPCGNAIVAVGHDNAVRIYRRRRPEWWWGVFWLTEFWATVFLAGLFAWTVWRDRRALSRPAAASEQNGDMYARR